MADAKEPDKPEEPLTDLDLRMFIIEHMASADIGGKVMVENMDMAFHWLRDGTVAAAEPVKHKPRVKIEASNG
jgi:hypothetical protein